MVISHDIANDQHSILESVNRRRHIHLRSRICTVVYSLVIVLAHLRTTGSQDLRPVWQWIDPRVKGISWPASRIQGEMKACTCAFVDNNKKCIDSDALGLRASFPCGLMNFRNRAGNDETLKGMRTSPCYCTFNQGALFVFEKAQVAKGIHAQN